MTGTSTWNIWGHTMAVQRLQELIAAGRVPHGILLSGASGSGKTALATAMAKALICRESADGRFCNQCAACRRIERGAHPDVQLISRATQHAIGDGDRGQNLTLTIETIRRVANESVLRPLEGGWRVFLIDDVESMQGVAQEALLKTLEEPPAFLVIVLLSDNSETLLPTILSRCLHLELGQTPKNAIAEGLVAEGVTPARADELATLSAGRPGWARLAFEQPDVSQRRLAQLEAAVEWLGASEYHRLLRAYKMGDQFQKERDPIFEQLAALSGILRAVLLGKEDVRVDMPPKIDEVAQSTTEHWSQSQVLAAAKSTEQCIEHLLVNARPRLAMEVMVSKWPLSAQLAPR